MLGRRDLSENLDLDNPDEIAELRGEVDEIMTEWMKGRTREEVFLDASRNWMLPVAPIMELHEVLADPQFNQRGLFQDIHH